MLPHSKKQRNSPLLRHQTAHVLSPSRLLPLFSVHKKPHTNAPLSVVYGVACGFSVYLVNIFNYCIKSSKGIVAGMVNVGMRHNGTR